MYSLCRNCEHLTRKDYNRSFCSVRGKYTSDIHLKRSLTGKYECMFWTLSSQYWENQKRSIADTWVLVDPEKDVWVSPVLRKYVGRGNPKEYRAYYCKTCRKEVFSNELRPKRFVRYIKTSDGNCPECLHFVHPSSCKIHGELILQTGKRKIVTEDISQFSTCESFANMVQRYSLLGHYFTSYRWHPVALTVKHPTCEVYACPICGMPANPSLNGYCCNQHREMMMRNLLRAYERGE